MCYSSGERTVNGNLQGGFTNSVLVQPPPHSDTHCHLTVAGNALHQTTGYKFSCATSLSHCAQVPDVQDMPP